MTKDEAPLAMLRRLRNITQQELADAVGVSETTVRNWEAGRNEPNLTPKQFKALLKALGITAEELPDSFAVSHDTSAKTPLSN